MKDDIYSRYRRSAVRIVLLVATTFFVLGVLAGRASSYASDASWYGPGLYGNLMGCGGYLSRSTWGIAHKTLPCGTRIKVCMRVCAFARVTDRGPFVYGRMLDLTKPVADYIGLTPYGHAVVVWKVVR